MGPFQMIMTVLIVFFPFRVEWMYLYQGMVVLATNQVWVDLGGRGCIPQSHKRRQSSHEELCQENALTN